MNSSIDVATRRSIRQSMTASWRASWARLAQRSAPAGQGLVPGAEWMVREPAIARKAPAAGDGKRVYQYLMWAAGAHQVLRVSLGAISVQRLYGAETMAAGRGSRSATTLDRSVRMNRGALSAWRR